MFEIPIDVLLGIISLISAGFGLLQRREKRASQRQAAESERRHTNLKIKLAEIERARADDATTGDVLKGMVSVLQSATESIQRHTSALGALANQTEGIKRTITGRDGLPAIHTVLNGLPNRTALAVQRTLQDDLTRLDSNGQQLKQRMAALEKIASRTPDSDILDQNTKQSEDDNGLANDS